MSGLDKFKTQTETFYVATRYPREVSEYRVVVKFKPIQKNKCSFTITNTITNEQLSFKVDSSWRAVMMKLNDLYDRHVQEIKARKEELNPIRQRSIKRYENMMRRNGKTT